LREIANQSYKHKKNQSEFSTGWFKAENPIGFSESIAIYFSPCTTTALAGTEKNLLVWPLWID